MSNSHIYTYNYYSHIYLGIGSRAIDGESEKGKEEGKGIDPPFLLALHEERSRKDTNTIQRRTYVEYVSAIASNKV